MRGTKKNKQQSYRNVLNNENVMIVRQLISNSCQMLFLKVPINPYGKAKKMSEDIILDFSKTSKMAVMILRFASRLFLSNYNHIQITNSCTYMKNDVTINHN